MLSYSLSSGVKYPSISFIVSFISAVSDQLCFRSVVICVFLLLLPAANLYTWFQGLANVVMLLYSFHALIFSFLMVAAYRAFPSKFGVLRCSLSSSLFPVLWYLRLKSLVLFLIIINSSVHQGIGLCAFDFFWARFVLNVLLHTILKIS